MCCWSFFCFLTLNSPSCWGSFTVLWLYGVFRRPAVLLCLPGFGCCYPLMLVLWRNRQITGRIFEGCPQHHKVILSFWLYQYLKRFWMEDKVKCPAKECDAACHLQMWVDFNPRHLKLPLFDRKGKPDVSWSLFAAFKEMNFWRGRRSWAGSKHSCSNSISVSKTTEWDCVFIDGRVSQ